MRHLGEAKPAIAIGVDQVAPGHEAVMDPALPPTDLLRRSDLAPRGTLAASGLRRPR